MEKLLIIEDIGHAFILNPKQNHVYNSDAGILILADGERKFFEKVEDSNEFQRKAYEENLPINITGGSVACSICGHAAIDEAYYYEV